MSANLVKLILRLSAKVLNKHFHQRWNTLQQFRSLNINIELFTFRLFLSSVVTMMMSAQISPKLRPKSLFEFKL